ncbi:hypothetical protein Hanom_Chr16g01427971 [Helianthus anomalus]
MEKEKEAKVKGVSISELQLQDADYELHDGQLKGMTCGWKAGIDVSILLYYWWL